MMGLSSFDETWWADGLRNDDSAMWEGNSSFGNVEPFHSGAVGGYKRNLSKKARLYIEAVCHREMLAMGYIECAARLTDNGWRCSVCGWRPTYRNGVHLLSEDIAVDFPDYPVDAHDHRVHLEETNFWFISRAQIISDCLGQYFSNVRKMLGKCIRLPEKEGGLF